MTDEQNEQPEKLSRRIKKPPKEPPMRPREKMPGPVNPWIWIGLVVFVIALMGWKGFMRDEQAVLQQKAEMQKRADALRQEKEDKWELYLQKQNRPGER